MKVFVILWLFNSFFICIVRFASQINSSESESESESLGHYELKITKKKYGVPIHIRKLGGATY